MLSVTGSDLSRPTAEFMSGIENSLLAGNNFNTASSFIIAAVINWCESNKHNYSLMNKNGYYSITLLT